MPDIFDRIAPDQSTPPVAAPPGPQGDIFDRVASSLQPPPTAAAPAQAPAPQSSGPDLATPIAAGYEAGTGAIKGTSSFLANEGHLFAAGFERGARILGLDKSADYWRDQQPAYSQFQQNVEAAYPQSQQAQQNPHGIAAAAGVLGGIAPQAAAAVATGGASLPITAGFDAAGSSYDRFYQAAKAKGLSDSEANRLALEGGVASGAVQGTIARASPLAKLGGSMGGGLLKTIGNSVATQAGVGIAQSQVDPVIGKMLGLEDPTARQMADAAEGSIFPSVVGGVAFGGLEHLAGKHGGDQTPAPTGDNTQTPPAQGDIFDRVEAQIRPAKAAQITAAEPPTEPPAPPTLPPSQPTPTESAPKPQQAAQQPAPEATATPETQRQSEISAPPIEPPIAPAQAPKNLNEAKARKAAIDTSGPLADHEQEAVDTLVALGEKAKTAEALARRARAVNPDAATSVDVLNQMLALRRGENGPAAKVRSQPKEQPSEESRPQAGAVSQAKEEGAGQPTAPAERTDKGIERGNLYAERNGRGELGGDRTPANQETHIATQAEDVPARYEAIEADQLIPSHNEMTFQPNPEHSGGQMRDYAGDKNEQLKVIDYSKPSNFDSRHLLSDDPGPANGPPMVDERNSAIGGNNRAMIAKRVYADAARGAKLKADTITAARKFGIDPDQLQGMNKPVIVRRLAERGMNGDRLAALSRILQKGRTQETSAAVDAVSRAKILLQNPRTLDALDGLLGGGKSVREMLGKEGDARRMLHHLEDAGVLTQQEISQYATPQGTFSEEGKRLVERTLLGTVVDDPHLLDDVPAPVVNKLTGNVGPLAALKAREGFDLSGPLKQAVEAYHRFRADGGGADAEALQKWLAGGSGGDVHQTSLIRDPIQDQPQAKALLKSLAGENAADFKARLKSYADDARSVRPDQGKMFGAQDVKPAEAFQKAFGGDVPDSGSMFLHGWDEELPEGESPRFTDAGRRTGKASETLRQLGEQYKFKARIVDDAALSGADRDVQRIAARFGITAHFVEAENGGGWNNSLPFKGVSPQNAPDMIFLKHGVSGDGVHEVLGHELVHAMQKNAPDVYYDLLKSLDPKTISAGTEKYLNTLAAGLEGKPEWKQVYDRLSKDQFKAQEEGLATVVGQAAMEPRVWNDLAGRNPTLWEKVKGFIADMLDRIKGTTPKAEAIRAAFEKFAQRGASGESVGSGADFEPNEDIREENLLKAIEAAKSKAAGNPANVPMERPDLSQIAPSVEGRSVVSAVDKDRNATDKPALRRDQDVNAKATALLQDRDAVRKLVADKAGKRELLSDHEMVAARTVLNDDSIEAMKSGDRDKLLAAAKLANDLRTSREEWGRIGRQMRDPILPPAERMKGIIAEAIATPEVKGKGTAFDAAAHLRKSLEIRDRIKNVLGIDLSDMTDKKLSNPETAAAVVREIQSAKAGLGDKIYEYWVNALLGPTTQTVKLTSDLAHTIFQFGLMRPMETAINSMIGDPKSAQAGEWKHLAAGMWPGIQQGAKNWMRSFRTELPVFEDDVNGTQSVPRAAIGGTVGRVVRLNTRLLQATTQFAKTISGTMQAHAEAYRAAKAKGLTAEKMSQYVADQVANLNSPAWQRGLGFANDTTFSGPPSKLGKALTNLKRDVPIFKYIGIGPFVNIGEKMTTTGLKMTPLDLVRMAYKGTDSYFKIKAGEEPTYTRKDFVTDAARQLIGFGATAAMWGMVGGSNPIITGSAAGESKKAERDEQYRNAPPMSIRIGQTWHSYNRVEPFATALGTVVNGINSIKEAKAGKDYDAALGDFVSKQVHLVADKTFLKSLGDIVAAIESPERKAESLASSFITSWVPNTIKQPMRALDDSVRENRRLGGAGGVQQFGEKLLRGALPGVDAPAPKVDLWGQDIKKGGSPVAGTDFLYRVLSPSQAMPTDSHRMDRMITAWNTAHPNEEYHPQTPEPAVKVNGKAQKMDDATYNLYLRAVGRVADATLNGPLGEKYLNADNPTADDIKGMKDVLAGLHKNCREMVADALGKKAAGDTKGYEAAMATLREAAENPAKYAGIPQE